VQPLRKGAAELWNPSSKIGRFGFLCAINFLVILALKMIGGGPVDWQILVVGCLGGLIPDALRLIQGRYAGSLPAYLSTPNFWVGLILLVLIAGLVTWFVPARDFKEALAFGYGAPEFLSRLLSNDKPPSLGPTRPFNLHAVRHFWSF
jgi:hypothetical protein